MTFDAAKLDTMAAGRSPNVDKVLSARRAFRDLSPDTLRRRAVDLFDVAARAHRARPTKASADGLAAASDALLKVSGVFNGCDLPTLAEAVDALKAAALNVAYVLSMRGEL